MRATHPEGRGRVKLEVEACAPGLPFGNAAAPHEIATGWTDVTADGGRLDLAQRVDGLTNGTLYHWRARVLHAPFSVTQAGVTAPPKPGHGPWRRVGGQAVEADIRMPEPAIAVSRSRSARRSSPRWRAGGARPSCAASACRPACRELDAAGGERIADASARAKSCAVRAASRSATSASISASSLRARARPRARRRSGRSRAARPPRARRRRGAGSARLIAVMKLVQHGERDRGVEIVLERGAEVAPRALSIAPPSRARPGPRAARAIS